MKERKKKVIRNRIIAFVILAAAIIAVIIVLVKCRAEEEVPETKEPSAESISTEESTEETESTVDTVNEKPITLYILNSSEKTCTKASVLSDAWMPSADLATFAAFLYDEEQFTYTTWVTAVKDSWNSVSTDIAYKIGYELSFDLNGEHILITILEPDDIEECEYLYNGDYPSSGDYSAITGYMGVWVYDDMAHEVGEWYSHVTSATKTDSTVLTAIKLRPTPLSSEISNLILRGFSYSSEEEFDEDGHYIGNYAYTVTITNGQ